MPVSSNPTDAAKCHKSQALPPIDPVFGLRGEHTPVLKLAGRVPADIAIKAIQAEIIEGDAAIGGAGHRSVGEDLTRCNLMKPVIRDLVGLIFAAASPYLVKEVSREVKQRALGRIEGAVAPVALDMKTERRRV